MSLTKPRGWTIGNLSLRGFAWSIGTGAACVLGGANLLVTLIAGVIAYVKGA